MEPVTFKQITFKYDSSLDLRDFLESASVNSYQVDLARKLVTCRYSDKIIAVAKEFKLEMDEDSAISFQMS
jgi:hypothetical protein